MLSDTGCILLPSQHTLRDYTKCYQHYTTGFSLEVDQQLMQAADIGQCPKRHHLVILLLDMYIREDSFTINTVVDYLGLLILEK